MNNFDVDLVVVGAGIHGAGVAQAAAASGYSVILLEQTAIAAGTSSRSSKLIHGGLRYLETGQLRLVRECLQERRILLNIAPHLVRLVPFYIPIYRQTRRRPWQIRIGLSLYATLTGWDRSARFRSLPIAKIPRLPKLETRDLQAVFQYWDAQTDDAALTRAVVASARECGARVICPGTFVSAHLLEHGAAVVYRDGTHQKEVHARVVVNAAGPWVDRVTRACHPVPSVPAVDLVQGTHIIVDAPPPAGIFYLESPSDGRAIFVMPWQDKMLIGTTEAEFDGDPATVCPKANDQAYLLEAVKHYFPDLRALSNTDVVASFAGLRVLPRADGRAFSRPRETLLPVDREHRPRWIGIYGGKLTAYRATAEKVIHKLASSLPAPPHPADTRFLFLPNGDGPR